MKPKDFFKFISLITLVLGVGAYRPISLFKYSNTPATILLLISGISFVVYYNINKIDLTIEENKRLAKAKSRWRVIWN